HQLEVAAAPGEVLGWRLGKGSGHDCVSCPACHQFPRCTGFAVPAACPWDRKRTPDCLWIAMCTNPPRLWILDQDRSSRLWTPGAADLATVGLRAVEPAPAGVDDRAEKCQALALEGLSSPSASPSTTTCAVVPAPRSRSAFKSSCMRNVTM